MDFLLLRFATEGAFPPSPGPPATPFPSGFALKRGTAEGEGSAEQAGGVPAGGAADHGPEPRLGMPGAKGREGESKAGREGRSQSSERERHSRCWDSGGLRAPRQGEVIPGMPSHGTAGWPGPGKAPVPVPRLGCGENTWKGAAVKVKKAKNMQKKN